MTKGNSHIREEDFKRYLDNKMTENERNAFEKKLQKDPFAAEALEGFETVSLADIKNDLSELQEKIHSTKRRNNYRYFAAAATILLVITAGVIWIQFNSQNPLPEVVEKTEDAHLTDEVGQGRQKTEAGSRRLEERKTSNKEQSELSAEQPDLEEKSELDDEVQIQDFENSPSKQLRPTASAVQAEASHQKSVPKASEITRTQNVSRTMDSNLLDIGGVQTKAPIATLSSKNKMIRGKVVSAIDNEPLPGVTLVEKGTTNGIVTDINGNFELKLLNDSSSTVIASFVGMESAEFQPNQDSVYQIELEPGDVALNEVVVVGNEIQRKKSPTGSVSMGTKTPNNSKPEPVCGLEEYNNYLEDNAILPDDYSRDKEVVKLLLKLDHDGEIISIENKNNTDLVIFEKAKELVHNGPDWNPEFKNDENIASEIKLKIVFTKMN